MVTPGGTIDTFKQMYAADVKADTAGNVYASDGFYQLFKIRRVPGDRGICTRSTSRFRGAWRMEIIRLC